ncbi:MAG: transglutaminase family protein [Hyphomicrobium sp.]|nr:transglutaminase family protein [Hyphomicrobium sp.]
MLLEIRHITTYRYGSAARYAVEALRLTPPEFDGQHVLNWSIIMPGIERAARFRDAFGNLVHLVSQTTEHDQLVIEAQGIVETEDRIGVTRGLVEPAPLRVYLRETARTKPNDPIRAMAAKCTTGCMLDRLHKLMHGVHAAIAYETGATHVHTSAAEALADGRGVCQDHAHLFISAARTIGIPARYVNGYFLSGQPEPSEAHHAWAEAWVEGLGWVGFDPANLICPTERYVRLATGLDASTAAPIRGTQRGGGHETLDVSVEVQQQGAQQQ